MQGRHAWRGLAILGAVLGVACGASPEAARDELGSERLAAEARVPSQPNHGGATRWLVQARGQGFQIPTAVAQDKAGNAVVAITFQTELDVGGGPIRPANPAVGNLGLVKLRPNGQVAWVRVYGASMNVDAVALDSEKDLVLAGWLHFDSVDFGCGPFSFQRFIVKLDEDGDCVWVREIPGQAFFGVNDIATDSNDNIALAGFFIDTVDLGQGPVSGGGGFLATYSPDGEPRWSYVEPVSQSEGSGVAVDGDDNVYLAGSRFTAYSPVGDAFGDPFVLKFSPDGALQWTRRLTGALGLASRIAVGDDRVVLTGFFRQAFQFRHRTVTPRDARDAFLVAYTLNGRERWVQNFGATGTAVAMDDRGGAVVLGKAEAGDPIGGIPVPGAPGAESVYVARFDSQAGAVEWVRGFASPNVLAKDLSVDSRGRSVSVGFFSEPMDFGDGPIAPDDTGTGFILGLGR